MESELQQNDSFRVTLATTKRAFLFACKKEPRLVILTLVLSILLAGLVYLQLASFSNVVDQIVLVKSIGGVITRALFTNSIILALSFLIPAILQNIYNRYYEDLNMVIGTHIQLYRIDMIAALDIGTIEGAEFQTKLERAEQWGVTSIGNLAMLVLSIVKNITGLVISALILFFINPWLVLFAVVGGIPAYFIQKKYGAKLYDLYHERTDEARIMGDRNSFFRNPKKIIEIALFNLAARFKNDVKEANNSFDNKVVELGKRRSYATFGTDILSIACLLLAIAFVTMQTIQGDILVGGLLLAFSTYSSFTSIVQEFFWNTTKIENQARYSKRWFDLFDTQSKMIRSPDALKPSWETPPVIEFKNVSFLYPETDVVVLKNISLTLQSGEKLAIVGLNGAGKTTLIKLLCRVYDPTEGVILVNGVDLRGIDLDYWHTALGVLFQDFSNFQMTAREAIAISRPDEPINDEKVVHSAKAAEADEFIEKLPNKYHHLIWKGFKDGVELSKGQFQRMAVARILYRNALISVLDEPTSAIDAVAEEKIFEVLETKMTGKTVVLISHRFSTVKNADKIAVIEHGELKEMGSHKELMAQSGRYHELYTMQASRYLESA